MGTMPEYDFKNIVVLVVEDGEYMRQMLSSALKNMGVGTVITKHNGGEAIDYLAETKKGSFGVTPVDVIISDWEMEPVDGLMLLRWVRRHADSPNRFVPFLMIEADLDRAKIAQAINQGTHELLAKPFTADTIRKAMLALVERHRLFVRTPQFFGPDRRRKRVDFGGMEKREIVESGGKGGQEAWSAENPEIRFYKLPNLLKEKLTANTPSSIINELTALATAEADFQEFGENYADWAKDQVKALQEQYKACLEENADVRRIFMRINELANDLRSQGATFGYPLVSDFSKSLCSITHSVVSFNKVRFDLIKTHLDSIDLVIRQKLEGDGGPMGKEIAKSLNMAAKKVLQDAQPKKAELAANSKLKVKK